MKKKDVLVETFLETNHLMNRYSMIWYGKNFGGLDPQQGQGRILTALRRMKTISQKELGFILNLRPQSLGELLQKLEGNGYIRRYRSAIDKRALMVELTGRGETFLEVKPDYEEIFSGMTAKERTQLENSLEKISEQLKILIDSEIAEEEEFFF